MTVVTGHEGRGLHFDGADDGIAITRSGPLVDIERRSFTFSTWLRSTGGGTIFSNHGDGASRVHIGTHGASELNAWIGNTRYNSRGSFFPTDGQWHHFMVSVSVRTPWDYEVEFFLDHTLAAGGDISRSGDKHLVPSTSPELFVGIESPGVDSFNGDLDEVRLYDGAVRPVGVRPDRPIAYFDFMPTNAPAGLDLSGEGSLGSFYGAATTVSDGFDRGLDLPASGAGFMIQKRGALASLGSGPFTLSFWFRGGNAGGFLFRNRAPGSALIRAYRPSYSDQTLQVNVGNAQYHRGDFFTPVDSAWHLFTLTVDYRSSTDYSVSVYLDGQRRIDESHRLNSSTLLEPGGTELHIGASQPGVGTHLGQIDEVRVFDYVRVPTIPLPPVTATCV